MEYNSKNHNDYEKELGKITSASFGFGGYQDAMFGLSLSFQLQGSGCGDFISGGWAYGLIDPDSKHCKWSEADRSKQMAAMSKIVCQILSDAKVSKIDSLVGKPIEVAKRMMRPLPHPPVAGYKPEPAINSETYEELLAIIRHAGASFEGTPQTYVPLGEEGLRDNVLSHINVVFEGKATGETFRKYGKTDIRLEEESRSAFVGECKLWGGEKVLLDALSQLLGYVTWRDCKAALVIFNKDVAGFSGIQETINVSLREHSKFLRAMNTGRAGEWRFVFQSQEDAGREVTVHVFVFNLYVVPERPAKKR